MGCVTNNSFLLPQNRQVAAPHIRWKVQLTPSNADPIVFKLIKHLCTLFRKFNFFKHQFVSFFKVLEQMVMLAAFLTSSKNLNRWHRAPEVHKFVFFCKMIFWIQYENNNIKIWVVTYSSTVSDERNSHDSLFLGTPFFALCSAFSKSSIIWISDSSNCWKFSRMDQNYRIN